MPATRTRLAPRADVAPSTRRSLTMIGKLLAEGVGAFALCFIAGGAILANQHLGGGSGPVGAALAYGLALAVMVSATLHVSGGQLNPAVTLGLLAVGRVKVLDAFACVAAQLAGALAAGLLLTGTVFLHVNTPEGSPLDLVHATPHYNPMLLGAGDSEISPEGGRIRTRFDATRAAVSAMTIEAVLTFFLMFAFMATAVDPRRPNVGGFAVGLTVAAEVLVAAPLTGAAMNPARYVGTGYFTSGSMFWTQLWVYWAGPVLGAVVAAVAYEYLMMPRAAQTART